MKINKNLYFAIITLIWIGCKPDSSPNTSATTKSISSVVFKAADNSLLSSDISGTISSDSVKISFPAQVDLSNLIPTITQDGASINPPSRTARNFSSPVTYTVTAQDGSIKNYIFSARNVTLSDSINMALGRWRLVKDSVSNVNNYYHSCGGPQYFPIPGVWVGAPGDYWEFKANNVLDLKYSINFMSGTYQFLPGQLKINDPCWPIYAQILVLNSTTASFYFSDNSANGGHWGRIVWLAR